MFIKIYLIYLAVISLLAIILTARDKRAARDNSRRVKERALLFVSLIGGAAAMFLTMLAIRHKTSRAKFMITLPLIVLVQVMLVICVFNHSLSVSHYNIDTEKISGSVVFALVTDLHSCDYGRGQIRLLEAIDREAPDAVLLAGDIFDDELPPGNAIDFIAGVAGKYPCYYVSGNHEFWSGEADNFKNILASYGVKVLSGTTEFLEVRGEIIEIRGIDDPDTDRYASRALSYAEQKVNLGQTKDKDIYTILLSHRPERIKELLPLEPDLVVSGHAHGGQWRIPIILRNGLLAPNQGWFPKYTNGKYFFEDTELIVSRGLAKESTGVPRAFNRPEIVIITLE